MHQFIKPGGQVQTVCLGLLTLIALAAALYAAKGIFAPVTLGIVVAIVVSPGVRMLARIGVPRALSTSIALLVTGILIVLLIAAFGPILMQLVEEVPRIQEEIRWWVVEVTRAIRGLDSIQVEIEQTLSNGDEAVEEAMPSLIDALWIAPNFAAQLMTFAGTFFFFLLTQEDIYNAFPQRYQSLRAADRAVSYYFVTVTIINACLGAAVFGIMTLIGMPSPVVWGAAAFLLNFILYLGPVLLIFSLFIVGLTQFNGAYSFLPPIAYFALNLTEAQFVTPTLVGQRLRLNPLGVFLAILFGLWLWGPVGGIVALPVLVWVSAYLTSTDMFQVEQEVEPVQS